MVSRRRWVQPIVVCVILLVGLGLLGLTERSLEYSIKQPNDLRARRAAVSTQGAEAAWSHAPTERRTPSALKWATPTLKPETESVAPLALPTPDAAAPLTSTVTAATEKPAIFYGGGVVHTGDSLTIQIHLTDFLGRVQPNTAYVATMTINGVATNADGTSDDQGLITLQPPTGSTGTGSFLAFTTVGNAGAGGNGAGWVVFDVTGITSFTTIDALVNPNGPLTGPRITYDPPFPVENLGGIVSLVTDPPGVIIPDYYDVTWTVERDGAYKAVASFVDSAVRDPSGLTVLPTRNSTGVVIRSPGTHHISAQGTALGGTRVETVQVYKGNVLLDPLHDPCVVGGEAVPLKATVVDGKGLYSWPDETVNWVNVDPVNRGVIVAPEGSFSPGQESTYVPDHLPVGTAKGEGLCATTLDIAGQSSFRLPRAYATVEVDVLEIAGLSSIEDLKSIEITPSSATVATSSRTDLSVKGIRKSDGSAIDVPARWSFDFAAETIGTGHALFLPGTNQVPTSEFTHTITYAAPATVPAATRVAATLCDLRATATLIVAGSTAQAKPIRSGNPQEPHVTLAGMGCGDDKAPQADTHKNAGNGPGDVFLHNGEEHMDEVDLFVKGRGDIHFAMTRSYRSRVQYYGPLGAWDFGYNEHLVFESNGDVTHVDGRGRADTYRKVEGSDVFASPSEFFTTLRVEGDGSYALRDRQGFKRSFDILGRLTAYFDKNLNALTFEYDSHGRLAFAYDAFERPYGFIWNDQGLLASVTDFSGRTVSYSYDANRDLVAVAGPAVTGTSTLNDFPEGRTVRYTYSSGFDNADLNHNLLTVTMPVEVATGGPPCLHIAYGTDPSDPFTFDRVIQVTKGGTNASGVAAGGTFHFTYSNVVPEDSLPPDAVTKGVMVDPAGNTLLEAIDSRSRLRLSRKFTRGLRPNEPASYFCGVYDYNDDSLITKFTHRPQGNSIEYTYDTTNPNRMSRCNLLETKFVPDEARGGGEPILVRYTYEPLYNQVASVTDPRELSPTFVPPLGANAPGRYTTKFFFDYEEGTDLVSEAQWFGIDLSGVARGLGDLNGDGRTDQQGGNVVKTCGSAVNLIPGSNLVTERGSTVQQIVTQTQFNDVGQPVKIIDAEGNVTGIFYYPENDPDGDGNTVSWNSSDAPQGYVQSTFVDLETSARRTAQAAPIAASTFFQYDQLGHVAYVLNPRGVYTSFEWSALDELVSVQRATDTFWAHQRGQLLLDNQDFAYASRSFYDANGRVVRQEVENRDGNAPELGPWLESTTDYDILGHPVQTTRRTGVTDTITTQFRYTPNELLELVIKPEGNQVKYEWDERDLLLRLTTGYGSTTDEPSVVTYNYDGNKNLVEVLDPQHVGADSQPTRTTFVYDGFDRTKSIIDALGGHQELELDPASQVTKEQFYGHPAGRPQDPAVLLTERRFAHDELGRVFQTDVKLFVASGFVNQRPFEPNEGRLTPGDGYVTARAEFDALSRVVYAVDDDLQTSHIVYDGAGRAISRSDAIGNVLETDFDLNANPVRVRRTEISPQGRVPNETFTTFYVWDSLDRLARVTDNAGQTARNTYDSRGNLIENSDAVGPLVDDPLNLYVAGQINSTGNTTRYFHDGIGRVVRKILDLRVNGQGGNALDTSNPASPQGTITQTYLWDRNSRLAGILDDKGNATAYLFDNLDRVKRETAADLTFRTTSYDRDGNPVSSTDANGTTLTRHFDALNRMTGLEVTPSTTWHVRGSNVQTFEFDGASRKTKATETVDSATSVVTWTYDSLNRVLEEAQDGQVVSHVWAGDGRRLACTYSGGTRLDYSHDANKRVTSISQSSTGIVGWEWIGPGYRPLKRTTQNGVTLSFLDDAQTSDAGWDAVQRVARMRYLAPNGTALVDLAYGYDRANNRTSETRNHESRYDTYTYDSAYRLVQAQYNVDPNALQGSLPQGVVGVSAETYTLDGVNNRVKLKQTLDVLNTAGTALKKKNLNYTSNSTNEYTNINTETQSYDANGNLLEDKQYYYRYDFRNLLVELRTKTTGKLRLYRYDALGRRIEKTWGPTTPDPGDPADDLMDDQFTGTSVTQRFVHDGWRVIEQKRSDGSVANEWVYGVGIDEPIRMTRKRVNGTVRDQFFYCQNAIGSVVAITDAAGALVERYKYLGFGQEEIYDPTGVKVTASAVGNPIRWQGRWRDSAEGSPLTYYRARYYDSKDGRFTTRDPIGVWGDQTQLGNGYSAFGNAGPTRSDPSGLNPAELLEGAEAAEAVVGETITSFTGGATGAITMGGYASARQLFGIAATNAGDAGAFLSATFLPAVAAAGIAYDVGALALDVKLAVDLRAARDAADASGVAAASAATLLAASRAFRSVINRDYFLSPSEDVMAVFRAAIRRGLSELDAFKIAESAVEAEIIRDVYATVLKIVTVPGFEATDEKDDRCVNIHHIVSEYAPGRKSREILDDAGISVQDPINKVEVAGHRGRHPDEYHDYVYESLLAVSAKYHKKALAVGVRAALATLGIQIKTPGTMLNHWITNAYGDGIGDD